MCRFERSSSPGFPGTRIRVPTWVHAEVDRRFEGFARAVLGFVLSGCVNETGWFRGSRRWSSRVRVLSWLPDRTANASGRGVPCLAVGWVLDGGCMGNFQPLIAINGDRRHIQSIDVLRIINSAEANVILHELLEYSYAESRWAR